MFFQTLIGDGEFGKHTEANRKDFDILIGKIDRIVQVVNDQLLPAYENEQKEQIAIAWLKKKAITAQFWLSAILVLASFLALIGFVIKTFLLSKPDL